MRRARSPSNSTNCLRSRGSAASAGLASVSANLLRPGATRSIGPVSCSMSVSAVLIVRVSWGTTALTGSSTVSSNEFTRRATWFS